ncbi:GPW/gp25 family protein [Stenotrophomonas maltophilia]|uniref:GPW/gp25 family protein n=1 Tax=Stenotrophomonas maltophilia TaxID=40324 RepID=UPI000749664A|nr:GPW/gp25 family protein [Stenotrophomonas maltophilia]KUJ04955.1 baseplate assembly protein [Stenotrophomonas maltophilia]MBH1563171.1 GPW/gp25 family protein [Stenotrophomonas maltophilia]MBH1642152.1 GPW/gp25 family protein [Stenotrophomonas maltophilia]MBH1699619.1 GPW/gp25 family protein [Stenotrophomonas maltophilia]MBH1710390.1 GPW/gp25 family protein [Stenotrophomonas maltophilia]
MIGMDAISGGSAEGTAHLVQSIRDVLTTPIGSRVQRRDYGSLLPELIDQPFNDHTRLQLFGATATALMRWEPRIRLTRVALAQGDAPGVFVLDLDYQHAGSRQPQRATVPLRFQTP